MNYYVMNPQSQLVFRGTLEQCKAWAQKQVQQFKSYGMKAPTYRVFYDSAAKPSETIN